ncbi:MAG: hypothetical protein LUQ65_13430 [Candidatus Helarchaeota archaeon]|nr:hypothetical protein [Candidatus Helarchaeota archaeon]
MSFIWLYRNGGSKAAKTIQKIMTGDRLDLPDVHGKRRHWGISALSEPILPLEKHAPSPPPRNHISGIDIR